MPRVTYEKDGHIALIGLDRPEKRNAFDRAMFDELAAAYTRFEEDADARCAVLFAHGEHFTAGLDLAQIAPELGKGTPMFPAGQVDPLGLTDRRRTKPVVLAIRGFCLTIGIELALASDVIIAADDTRFSQIEVKRGLFAFGGATLRFPAMAGWQNAMRWILTGDFFDAKEAYRLGLVQEIVPAAEVLARAKAIATTIANAAPLGVQAMLASARNALESGIEAEAAYMPKRALPIFASEDLAEGVRSLVEKREGVFKGR
jgi:enoyl-CoA hydratase/carnithine racemase